MGECKLSVMQVSSQWCHNDRSLPPLNYVTHSLIHEEISVYVCVCVFSIWEDSVSLRSPQTSVFASHIHGNVVWKHSSCRAQHEIPGVWWGMLSHQRPPRTMWLYPEERRWLPSCIETQTLIQTHETDRTLKGRELLFWQNRGISNHLRGVTDEKEEAVSTESWGNTNTSFNGLSDSVLVLW